MTADELARSYFNRSAKRMLALELLMQHEAFPDVVREAQEIVELVLKGMLRAVGIDPPVSGLPIILNPAVTPSPAALLRVLVAR